MAKNMWRKRWSDRYRGEMVLRRFDKEIDPLTLFLRDVAEGKPLSEVRLPKAAFDICKKSYPRKDSDSDAAWLATLANAVGMMLEVLFEERKIFCEENILEDRFYDEQAVAAELALEERIDAKIDRDILALTRMKTMQSMGLGRRRKEPALEDVPIKQVESPPIQSEPIRSEPLTEESPKVGNTP
jgi:hypothetical protein